MAKRPVKAVPPAPAAETQPVLSAVADHSAVTVIFKRVHRHGLVDYREGDTLTVSRTTADLLRQYDAIGEG